MRIKKRTKNPVRTYEFINNIKRKHSLKTDHKHKSLKNKNAKYKNTILYDENEKRIIKKKIETEKRNKYINNPVRQYEFNIDFFRKILKDKDLINIVYLEIIPKLEEICQNISEYKCNRRDIDYYYLKTKKFSKPINYLNNIILDEFLDKGGDNKNYTNLNYIYKGCLEKNKSKKKILCFFILNNLIKEKRYEFLKNKINKLFNILLKKNNKYKKIHNIIILLIDKKIKEIGKEIGKYQLKLKLI